MEWHIGDGVAELFTLGMALAILIAGWQLFRAVVALAMGALTGAFSFAVVAGVLLKNDAGLSNALQIGTLAGLVGALLGMLIGLRAQQICAAIGTFTIGGTLSTALFWALQQSDAHGRDTLGTALTGGVLAGLVLAALVNRFYDVMAAALMAAFVAKTFIPGQPGFWATVFSGDLGARGLIEVILDSLRWLSRSLWAALVVPAWIVVWAAVLRAYAWTPRSVEREPSMIPAWRGAITSATLIVLAECVAVRTWRFGELLGIYPVVWPVLVIAAHRLHERLRTRTRPALLGRYGSYLVFALLMVPLFNAAMLAVVQDLPSFHTDGNRLSSWRYLGTFYGGFISPRVAIADELGTTRSLLFALGLKWTMNLVVTPALLETGFNNGAPEGATDTAPAGRPRALAALSLSLASAFIAVAAWNLQALHRDSMRMALGLLQERTSRTLCVIPLPGARSLTNPLDSALQSLTRADALKLLLPAYDPGLNRVSVTRREEFGSNRYETTGCGGLVVPSNPRGGVGPVERVMLGGGRALLRVTTLTLPAGGADERSGVLAVVAVRDRTLAVDAIGTWDSQLESLPTARAELLGGQVAYVLPTFEADGNDGTSRGEEVWLDRDGRLARVGGYTLSTFMSCGARNMPWDESLTATAAFAGDSVRLTETHRFTEGSCVNQVPGVHVASAHRVVTRALTLRNGHLEDQQQGRPRAIGPGLPAAWIAWLRTEQGDEYADEMALAYGVTADSAASTTTTVAALTAQGQTAAPTNAPSAAPAVVAAPPTPPAPVVVSPTTATASSWFHSRRHDFSPWLAFDGNLRTAWNDGVEGSGVGEWIEARFDRPRHIRRVTFTPGWDSVSRHGDDLFMGNSRLRVATITVDGAVAATVEVGPEERSRSVTLDATGSALRITATDVHPGQRWTDVCVSEITIEADP